MYGIIYKITCLINSKIYIGLTTHSAEYRFDQHVANSRKKSYKHKSHLYNAIREYGEDNFTIEVIDTANSMEELCEKERYWISKLDARNPEVGMNIHEGGKGGKTWVGDLKLTESQLNGLKVGWYKPMSEENKKLVSKIHKGKIVSEETREKLRKAQTGKKASDETRRKMSECRIGKKLPKRSEKSIQRYRETSLNRVHIHKDEINKNVKIDELYKYLSDGWERGYLSKNKKI